jgi:hypothetical protein
MQRNDGDNTQGDRLAFSTERDFKCSQCGNMYPVGQSDCDVCGNHCTESTCMVIDSSSEGF